MDLSSERCFAIAKQSKADIRFGAFIEKNGQILGFGCNRHSTEKDRRESKETLGRSVDYCIHAEEAALMSAVKKEKDLSGAVLYVLGFLKDGASVKRERPFFTCKRCAEGVLLRYNLPVRVRTIYGWKELLPKCAHEISLGFQGAGFWKKIARESKNKGEKE